MYTVELIYSDRMTVLACVETESMADLFMIARGWLMESRAVKVKIVNSKGNLIMIYTKQ